MKCITSQLVCSLLSTTGLITVGVRTYSHPFLSLSQKLDSACHIYCWESLLSEIVVESRSVQFSSLGSEILG